MSTTEAALLDSLNVPLPDHVVALARDVTDALPETVRRRHRHTLVVKRLADADVRAVRDVLAEAPACEARIAGLDSFETDTGPVVYLAVESPGLVALHERLCAVVDPIDGIEGADYVPHVTVGRGGNPDEVADFLARDVPSVEWTVDALTGWNATYRERVDRFPLGR
jgi:2'-5' RNA ligase